MPSSILNSDDGVISGTAGLKNSGGDDAVLLIQTKGVTAQTVDAGQRTKFPTTIGVGGATPSTSGSGISFPATQSASTNANTLDDYEEGTWTPSVGGTATYSVQSGSYTKIGRTVFIRGDVGINLIGTGSATTVSGLPFSSSGNDSIPISFFGAINTSMFWFTLYTDGGGTALRNRGQAVLDATSDSDFSLFTNSTRVIFSGVYQI